MARTQSRYVALLRGINVGGKNKLPMTGLVELFEKAGCEEVSTYIQSGNVLFSTTAKQAAGLDKVIAQKITTRFKLDVPVVLRSVEEMQQISTGNPFLRSIKDTETLHVAFLADSPAETNVAALDPNRSPPDSFTVVGREVFLHCPNGFARTKLSNAWLDSKLKTTSTIRNWRTVLTLLELSNKT